MENRRSLALVRESANESGKQSTVALDGGYLFTSLSTAALGKYLDMAVILRLTILLKKIT